MPRDRWVENKVVDADRLLSPNLAPENVAHRRSRVREPHVRPLNDWVDRLRNDPRLPDGAGRTIPYFDPAGGGVGAQLFFLMQDPSEVATFTGFISPDNNDPSAANSTTACREAGLDDTIKVHWNIFPWWVNIKKSGSPVDSSRPPQT